MTVSTSLIFFPTVGTPIHNPVIFLPAATGGVSSAVMMQPQPFILMNPACEVSRVTPPPLIAAHNVYTGGGGNYIILSPSQTVPNSLYQVMSSAGAPISQTSKIIIIMSLNTQVVTSNGVSKSVVFMSVVVHTI